MLLIRLRFRYLADEVIVGTAVKDFFGNRHALRRAFVQQVVTAYRDGNLSTEAELFLWLRRNRSLRKRLGKNKPIRVPASAQAITNAYRWPVPAIASEAELADFLTLTTPRLIEWLTLPHRGKNSSVDHYRRRSVRKRDGSIRWIEQPAPTLKRIQRVIAEHILPSVPLHNAAVGFRAGRSVMDCAQQHVGKKIVVRIDLENFFGSINNARVRNLFMVAGYQYKIAKRLAWICTAPAMTQKSDDFAKIDPALKHSRLPQGAPTSPALANAVAFGLDRRVAALCESIELSYTRYADDLIFSSNHLSLTHAKRFATTVAVIAMEEGFQVNFRKTKFMRLGTRQKVLGLTVNQKANVTREYYENLKATLHNCAHLGVASQNRDAHPDFRASLQGQVAHVTNVNPNRGKKLQALLDKVKW